MLNFKNNCLINLCLIHICHKKRMKALTESKKWSNSGPYAPHTAVRENVLAQKCDFKVPKPSGKVSWLQNKSTNILCLLSWCPPMWWVLCSSCLWCQNDMWKAKTEFSLQKWWPNGLPFTICNYSSYLVNHLKCHVIPFLCTLISSLVIKWCS